MFHRSEDYRHDVQSILLHGGRVHVVSKRMFDFLSTLQKSAYKTMMEFGAVIPVMDGYDFEPLST